MLHRLQLLSAALVLPLAGNCDSVPAPTGPEVPARLEAIAGNEQNGVAGKVLPQPLVVRVIDAAGKPLPRAAVAWSVRSGGGGVSPEGSMTDTSGTVRATWTLGPRTDSVQVVEAAAGVGVTTTFRAIAAPDAPPSAPPGTPPAPPGGAATLAKSAGDGQTANMGAQLPVIPSVRVTDALGNPMEGVNLTWEVTSGGGMLTSVTPVTNAGGYSQGVWVLGRSPGTQTLRVSSGPIPPVVFTATATGALSFNYPAFTGLRLADDTLLILIEPESPLELRSVSAELEGRTAALSFYGEGYWRGKMPLTGLTRGAKTVVITGTDVAGGTGSLPVPFVYDRRPVPIVESPAPGALVTTTLRVRMTCQDDDPVPCTVLVRGPGDPRPVLAEASGSMDQVVSLAAHDGRPVVLQFAARDSARQETRLERTVTVEGSARLAEIASGGTRMWDVDASSYLFADSTAAGTTLRIGGRAGGAPVSIPAVPGRRPKVGYLTPRGAIFQAEGVSEGADRGIYEWRDGALLTLASAGTGLVVEGQWAAWNVPGVGTHRRDLDGGTTVAIGVTGNDVDVGPNGDLVWSASDGATFNVHRYRNGSATLLTTTSGTLPVNRFPVTDGVNVAYVRSEAGPQPPHQITLLTPGGTVALGGAEPSRPSAHTSYEVSNGWTAYLKPGPSGTRQVWSRAPDGTERQLSFFSQDSRIDALGPNGEVVFSSGGRRYLSRSPFSTAAVDIGGAWPWRVFWTNGELIVLIARSAFRVTGP